MKSINVKGTARTATGKKATRDLRKNGGVPCNLYGENKNENGESIAMSFATTQEELRKLVYSPDIYSVNLTIDGKECKAVMKELQFHPVTDQLLHVDFYEITEEKPIVMEVPIQMTGLAEGVKAGGKLAASVRKLKVRAPYPQDQCYCSLPADSRASRHRCYCPQDWQEHQGWRTELRGSRVGYKPQRCGLSG